MGTQVKTNIPFWDIPMMITHSLMAPTMNDEWGE